jgi:hypothetical protein
MISYIYLIYPAYFMMLNYLLSDNIPLMFTTKSKLITGTNAVLNCIMSLFTSCMFYFNDTEQNKNILFYCGTSYYIWDLFRIVITKDKKNYFYIYHHYVTILMLESINLNYQSHMLNELFLLGELSNISYHTVSSLLKFKNKKEVIVKRARSVQIFTHLLLRLIIPAFYLKRVFNLDNRILSYNLLNMYIMGFVWMYKLIKSYIDDYDVLKDN